MAIKSLNETTSIKCLCDPIGRLLNPDTGEILPSDISPDDAMTSKERELYFKFWEKDRGLPECVLRVDGEPALGIRGVFSKSWVREVVKNSWPGEEKEADARVSDAITAIKTSAEKFSRRPWMEGCEVYVGDGTSQGGHEILIVVPYDAREGYEEIARRVNKFLFRSVMDNYAALLKEIHLREMEEREMREMWNAKSRRAARRRMEAQCADESDEDS